MASIRRISGMRIPRQIPEIKDISLTLRSVNRY